MKYQDYVIKDGRFVGRFEEMYRDVGDPWHCSSGVESWKNSLLLGAVSCLAPEVRVALDVGCGLGALSERLWQCAPAAQWKACDISSTAVEKARERPHVEFFVHDVMKEPLPLENDSLDLIVMSEVLWYILPRLEDILADFRRVLRPQAHFLLLQYFLTPEDQQYGKEWIAGPADLIGYLTRTGFTIEQEVYLGLKPPHDVMLWARC